MSKYAPKKTDNTYDHFWEESVMKERKGHLT